MANTSNPLHLKKRGDVYYLRATVNGKEICRSLSTGEKRQAAARARAMLAEIRAERFEVLDQVKQRKAFATIGQVCDRFKDAAEARGVRARSVSGYIYSMTSVVRHGSNVQNVRDASTEILTGDLVRSYREAMLEGVTRDTQEEARARRTIRSTVTQARALFSRWARESYEDFNLPDLRPFLEAATVRTGKLKYRLPPQDLVNRTLKAGAELRQTDPDLYAVFLLLYGLGMRRGEATACRWDWFRQNGDYNHIDIIERDGFRPKSMGRSFPVDPQVWAHLQELRRDGDEYVLPGGNKTARHNLVSRRFAAWMRELGWDRDRFPKAGHELRKLIGSRWFTELGAEVAQAWLGHTSITTTCDFYADLTRQPKPLSPLSVA